MEKQAEGSDGMIATIELEQTLTEEISDEALEAAAGTENKASNYTLYFCTALDLCPGP